MPNPLQLISGVGRDRAMVLGALGILTVAAWAYLANAALNMTDMPAEMSAVRTQPWSVTDFLLVFVMWSVMMVAMMLPSASPMILTFLSIGRHRGAADILWRTGLFVLGYLVVWTGYSALAAAAQWIFHEAAVLSPKGVSTNSQLAGSLLFLAGLFQWTPLKHACLFRCRSPLGFLVAEWRPGRRGALMLGLKHGLNCAVCCWAIMALMFVLGVMNLLWMMILAAFCLIEKVAPAPRLVGRATGALLIAWSIWIVAGIG
jgi:predicted metal-binding membrane protein